MKRVFVLVLIVLSVALGLAPQAAARPLGQGGTGRDMAAEQEIYTRLSAVNPDAVPVFTQATEDMDSQKLEAARDGFLRVLALAPKFPDAARRLSYVELALDDVPLAIQYARQAHEVQDDPYNHIALAQALSESDDFQLEVEALGYAREAVKALPNDGRALLTWVSAASTQANRRELHEAIAAYVSRLPNDPVAHYFAGAIAQEDKQWDKAQAELTRAQQLGMRADLVQKALDSVAAAKAAAVRQNANRPAGEQALVDLWFRRGAMGLAAWAGGIFVLFGVGAALSMATLMPSSAPCPTQRGRRGLAWPCG